MKKVSLLHNPTAGDNEFSKKELVKLIKKEGFECSYASVRDDGWDKLDEDADFLAVAGGDGTVRRVAKALVKRRLLEKQYPIALLPHGTANNIANSLHIDGHPSDIMSKWHDYSLKNFDIGKVSGLENSPFFLEAFGFGLFPKLMKEMQKVEDDGGDSVEERLNAARKVLLGIVKEYKPRECRIIADGEEYKGKYLLVEVMNIRSIGPNLVLAPNADPGDGCFEVTLVPEEDRGKFEAFVMSQINGEEPKHDLTSFRAKKISISCEFKDLHVDDERIKADAPIEVTVHMRPSLLQFLVTEA